MGCCASGMKGREFDQKEDKLTELKKDDEIEEKANKKGVETPDDKTFIENIKQIKSHNENTNVRSYFLKRIENN